MCFDINKTLPNKYEVWCVQWVLSFWRQWRCDTNKVHVLFNTNSNNNVRNGDKQTGERVRLKEKQTIWTIVMHSSTLSSHKN